MENLSNYHKETRPWGGFEQFVKNEQVTVKIINVEPNQSLSLQRHNHRSEFWRILSGEGIIIMNSETHQAKSGSNFFIGQKIEHRITALEEGLSFLEISFGSFDENDIERIEDNYGRV